MQFRILIQQFLVSCWACRLTNKFSRNLITLGARFVPLYDDHNPGCSCASRSIYYTNQSTRPPTKQTCAIKPTKKPHKQKKKHFHVSKFFKRSHRIKNCVIVCQYAMCTNEQVRDYFGAITLKDLINSKFWTFNQKGAMHQPSILPALVSTTGLISYLQRNASASTTKLNSYLIRLYSQKPPLPKKTRA